MTCPTIDDFKEILRRESPEAVAREYVFGGDVYLAQEYPMVLQTLRRHLCPRLGLKEENVAIIGSAKMGFSLDPNSFPSGRFTKGRDIDVLVVSEDLFDGYWETMLRWHYPRRSERLPGPDWDWVIDRRKNLYWGWFLPDEIGYEGLSFPHVLKPLRDLKAKWLSSFKSLSLYPEFSRRDVNGRLYRTWDHALWYQASGLTLIKSQLTTGV